MASKIKSIPTLEGIEAERFINKAKMNEDKPKIDFTKQVEISREILLKSKITISDVHFATKEDLDKLRCKAYKYLL